MVGNHWAVCCEGQVDGGNQATGTTPPHTCVEGTEQFFLGEVHRPTPQCVCRDAGLCRRIQYQLPNGHSRVGFLLDAIQTSDAGLQAAMASIRTDDGPDGMRNDFEQSAAHLLPYDPVAKKHAAGSSKRGSAEVLAVSFETTDVAAFGTKPGIGKSGVHFRYYDKSEYSKLMKEQKTELCEWRKGGAEQGRSDARTKKAKFKKAVAAAVEKKISEQVKASEEEKLAGEKLRSLVASIVKETGGTTTSGRRATTVGSTTTKSKSDNPTMQKWGTPMSPEAVLAKPQWDAYGLHPAAAWRPPPPDASTPPTPPSLKGILKKAKNDDKS